MAFIEVATVTKDVLVSDWIMNEQGLVDKVLDKAALIHWVFINQIVVRLHATE